VRVALVHSYYRSDQPSGENLAVEDHAAALLRAGHDVQIFAQRSDQRATRAVYPVEAAVTVATGFGPSPIHALRRFRPDVVHVHNLFPNFGTRWLRRWDGPVVATLHNYRPLCAAGTLFRDGAICTACPDGARFASIRYRCYRGSLVATLPVAWRSRGGLAADALVRRADRVVVLSERSAEVYRRYGLSTDKTCLVPNFVPNFTGAPTEWHRRGWLFAGRLTEEKGVLRLLDVWPPEEPLDIAGRGPLMNQVCRLLPPHARMLGAMGRAALLTGLSCYEGLIMPSLWFEGAPLVMLEALAVGTPVIAHRGSGAADAVERFKVGTTVPSKCDTDGWRVALREVRERSHVLSIRTRQVFTQHFSEAAWTPAMTDCYRAAIRERS
jgi:glycosyltransferase involved in cell wall biosynthesis